MTDKNSQNYKIADPRSEIDKSQLTRESPVMMGLTSRKRQAVERFSREYSTFLDQVRIAPDVVDFARKLYEEYRRLGDDFITNESGTAFAYVKSGKRSPEEGMNILFAHNDSPCLQVKTNPTLLEWDPDKQPLHTGVRLGVFAYGGIRPYQYSGRNLDLVGWASIDGERKKIELPVYCPDICQHTDTRGDNDVSFLEAHLEEKLSLVTGYRNVPDLMNALGLKGKEDFARARLFAVPHAETTSIGDYYLSGYGHDARSGIYAALQAHTNISPKYTSVVIGFDKEEVGSTGSGGANGIFLDEIANRILTGGDNSRLKNLTEAFKLDVFKKSLAINADVDVAATSLEEDETRIDENNIAKLGYGPFLSGIDGLCDGDQIAPELTDRMMNMFKAADVPFQITGSALFPEMTAGTGSMNAFIAERGIPTVNISVPTGCTHSQLELIHKGDLFFAKEIYRQILRRK